MFGAEALPNRSFLIFCVLVNGALLAHLASRSSPNVDEAGHLAAGIRIWRNGRFDRYEVNPPLPRLIAAAPVAIVAPRVDSEDQGDLALNQPGVRREWSDGLAFMHATKGNVRSYFRLARWTTIPLSIVGGIYCWRWASELYGAGSGRIAIVLWSTCPNIIIWSSTICPDGPAAAMGITAGYYFWRWLRLGGWPNAFLTGIALGVALLTKLTWVILFVVWPALWLARLVIRRGRRAASWKGQGVQLTAILLLGLLVLNLGYLFEGTFTSLGKFTFVSRALAGDDSIVEGGSGGNRFVDGWLGHMPIPVPSAYVRGVDLQKTDFECGKSSYLFGRWSDRGWWFYYLVCASLKVPLGTWILGLLAIGIASNWGRHVDEQRQNGPRIDGFDELIVLLPAIVLFVFVSSQTGFSQHFRYVLPAFPFIFVWISRVAASVPWKSSRLFRIVAIGSLAWTVLSSLWVYPYSMSYFNELAGGPRGGYHYLLHSNIDWGQDVYELEDWFNDHPCTRPRYILFYDDASSIAFRGECDGELVTNAIAQTMPNVIGSRKLMPFTGSPGWYAMSVHRLYGPEDDFAVFRDMDPIATIGFSIRIYALNVTETRSSIPPEQSK